jgi:hypothetical protein
MRCLSLWRLVKEVVLTAVQGANVNAVLEVGGDRHPWHARRTERKLSTLNSWTLTGLTGTNTSRGFVQLVWRVNW